MNDLTKDSDRIMAAGGEQLLQVPARPAGTPRLDRQGLGGDQDAAPAGQGEADRARPSAPSLIAAMVAGLIIDGIGVCRRDAGIPRDRRGDRRLCRLPQDQGAQARRTNQGQRCADGRADRTVAGSAAPGPAPASRDAGRSDRGPAGCARTAAADGGPGTSRSARSSQAGRRAFARDGRFLSQSPRKPARPRSAAGRLRTSN